MDEKLLVIGDTAYCDKYPLNSENINISNENTVMLSYIYMVNFISRTNISRLPIEEYYDYLQFLVQNKFKQELIDYFALIYTPGKNKIDLELLDSIPAKVPILTYDRFKKH